MNSFQPWRTPHEDDAHSVDSSRNYWPPGSQAAPSSRSGEAAEGNAAGSGRQLGGPTLPGPAAGRPHNRLLASYAPPSSATLSEDEEVEGRLRARAAAAKAAGGPAEVVAAGLKSPPGKPPKSAASAADAQLAELRARIREDTLACRQVRTAEVQCYAESRVLTPRRSSRPRRRSSGST
jgi:hypothetical protein